MCVCVVSTFVYVAVPPTNLSIAGNQQIIANGQNMLTLTCTTDTAYPYPTVIWQNGNLDITAGVNQSDRDGAYGGRIAEGKLHVRPTRDMDGDIIWCSAENALNHDSSVRNFITFDLLCKLSAFLSKWFKLKFK